MTDPTPLPGLDEPATVETEQGRPVVVCRDCGEPLTATDSRRWQLGPHCRRKHGIHAVRRPGRFYIDQDAIPGT